jgi:hypothetical protein
MKNVRLGSMERGKRPNAGEKSKEWNTGRERERAQNSST